MLKNISLYVLVALLSAFIFIGCENLRKSEAPAQDWAGGMQSMSASVQKLLPFVFSFRNFKPEKHKDKLTGYIEDLHKQASYLPAHVGEDIMGKDPIVRFSVRNLRVGTAQALASVKSGHYEYARGVLKESLSTCFNCHTAQQIGPENLEAKSWMSTNPSTAAEKVDYYIATRQFDKAIQLLEETLKSKVQFYENPYELSSALRRYLAIQVRVKKDPKTTVTTLTEFMKNTELPYFLNVETKQWIRSLNDWQREGGKATGTWGKAKQLIKKGDSKTHLGSGQGGMVEYLRASSILHELLKSEKITQKKAEIYLALGEIYENLAELGVWDLSEAYYIGCIQTLPHTKTAQECYSHLERSIVMGFSGSSGVMVPIQERQMLMEMRALAN